MDEAGLLKQKRMFSEAAAREFVTWCDVSNDEETREKALKSYERFTGMADRASRLLEAPKKGLSNHTVVVEGVKFDYRKGIQEFLQTWRTMSVGHSDAAALRGLYAAMRDQPLLKTSLEGWMSEFQKENLTVEEIVKKLEVLIQAEQKKREKEFFEEFEALKADEGTYGEYSVDVFMETMKELRAKVEPLSMDEDSDLVRLKVKELVPVELLTAVAQRLAAREDVYKCMNQAVPANTLENWVSAAIAVLDAGTVNLIRRTYAREGTLKRGDRNAEKTCFYCKKKGHIERNCRKKLADERAKVGEDDKPQAKRPKFESVADPCGHCAVKGYKRLSLTHEERKCKYKSGERRYYGAPDKEEIKAN